MSQFFSFNIQFPIMGNNQSNKAKEEFEFDEDVSKSVKKHANKRNFFTTATEGYFMSSMCLKVAQCYFQKILP